MNRFDNFRIDVTAEGVEALVKCFELCCHERIAAYRVCEDPKKPRMFLYWTDSEKATSFIVNLPPHLVAQQVHCWLMEQVDYPTAPDHDGDNHKGFRFYNEDWGHVDGEWQAFAAIEPVWAMYGK